MRAEQCGKIHCGAVERDYDGDLRSVSGKVSCADICSKAFYKTGDSEVASAVEISEWTHAQSMEVYFCYCLAKFRNLSVVEGTYAIWRKRNPSLKPYLAVKVLDNID